VTATLSMVPLAKIKPSNGDKERVSARARNLDLGGALAKWQPKLDADAVKLLGSSILHQYGKAAAWAYRLCVEQPETANKQGKVTVRYPRGAEAERKLHAEATDALKRARTPEDALAVVLRLLVAQRLVDPAGLTTVDRQGVYEPQELSASPTLDKLAHRVAPASVNKHRAAQDAERQQREPARRDERAANLQRQRDKLAAGESVRCECCLSPIESAGDATEKDGALIHSGDCRAAVGQRHRRRGARRMSHRPTDLVTSIARETQMH